MTKREDYRPGRAEGARVDKDKDGTTWTLVLTRDLRHPPELVWEALTDPAQISAWAPFDADRNLSTPGAVNLSMAGTQAPPQSAPTEVRRAEKAKLLEYAWGGHDVRWELEARDSGTRLTLWTNIPPRYIAWGAAGWHICLDVLARLLDGEPIGRIVGPEAMKFDWQRLNTEYAAAFGIDTPDFKAGK